MLHINLAGFFELFHPLIDVLGVITLIALLLAGFILLVIWFFKTFYKLIISVLVFCFILFFILIILTSNHPDLMIRLLVLI